MWIERNGRWVQRLKALPWPRGTVRLQITVVFLAFTVLLLGVLNTYPVISTRDAVVRDKEQSLTATAAVISSALSGLDSLNSENVNQVMEILDVTGVTRIFITNERGSVVYDTWGELVGSNVTGAYPVLEQSMAGQMVFTSQYTHKQAFSSTAAAPVMVGGTLIGSVYLAETDAAQAEMIGGIQSRLLTMSAVLALIAVALSAAFSSALTLRIKQLRAAVRVVQAGDYTQHIETRGSDELTDLGEEFNSMTDILRRTEESRRQFVSDASHELKTPLASIRLLTDSILQTENMDKATTLEFVEDIGESASRLQRLSEKLLDLSRLDSVTPPERVPVDLSAAAERTLRLLSPLAAEKEVTLTCAAPAPVYILAGEDDISQILFNLTENAVKYNTPGGAVTVTVTGGDTAVLTVADTGIGIPEEDLPHIFSRFYRVDKARSREAGGSGLGLSIVSDAAALHGGSIEVRPNHPRGTVFQVTFPAYEGEPNP